ncbi:MAG TPA: 1-acyl-sn-glycerol-3-phosphate acyltransferase, partial [Streptosporangiaceae bacterium]|nr:1-acyl-sn-glycerol-3-phosphate acyltransferase [Streptosporangiaceae bacterium]
MLPPRLLRRVVLAPLVIALAIALVVLSPLIALLAVTFSLARRSPSGRMRGLRLLMFALAWLTAETATLFLCLGLWLASGFGGRMHTEPFQSRHYAIMRWFLDVLYRTATGVFGVQVEVDEPELTAEEQAARLARPVIVLSRHAGPGDSLLLVHHLLSVYGRRPRVVMKATMQLDPSLDVVGNRLPNVFVRHSRAGEGIFSEQIERLAGGLDRLGALVIFPEGGNWTPHRWRRGIRRLERRGRPDLAARARGMPNLLPPRPGGMLAAISACPDADVIFVAHAGLDTISSIGDVWRRFPVDQVIRARWWRVPSGQVPHDLDREAQVRWLYGWWERIDRW